MVKDQTLIFLSSNNGKIEIIKKKKKNTIPKLLLEEISIFLFHIKYSLYH